jgi:peptidoglycan/LPS O-acetylase OafA/YrhL
MPDTQTETIMSTSIAPSRARPPIARFFFPELPPIQGTSHSNIPSLDGIRAVSILLVIVSHCGLGEVVPGGLGVTIFFFLSGYLITTLLRLEFAKTRTVNLKNFYIRRCLRILPPCYIVLIGALGLAIAAGEEVGWLGVLSNVAYFTNYYGCFGGTEGIPGLNVLWSLAVEEHFYLVFPMIYLSISAMTRRRQGTILAAICVAVLAWRCVLVFYYHCSGERTYAATDTRLDSILWGCLFAIVSNPSLGDPLAGRMATWPMGTLALAVLGFSLIFRAPWFRETFRYTIQGLALMPLFALAIRKGVGAPLGFLNWYGMRLLGVYSYTIYLTHFVVLHYLSPSSSPRTFPLTFLVALTSSFLLAATMYQLVDRPAAEVRKRYSL